MQVQEQKQNTPRELFNVNPLKWHEAIGLAREFCADLAEKGCEPEDAVAAYGLSESAGTAHDWTKAAQLIALMLCSPAHQRPC